MNKFFSVAAAASVAVCALSSAAFAEGKIIGVSWSNFQEERWKTDEAAMKAAIEANGDTYISADAQLSASKQLTDVESLIAQGADALVILSVDSGSVGAAVDAAAAEGIPVLGYDRLIEDNRAFYLTFDNKEVGRVIARSIKAAVPSGNYAIIKGDKGERIVSKRLASGPNSLAALGLKNPTAIVGIVSQQFSSPTGAIVIFLTGVIA